MFTILRKRVTDNLGSRCADTYYHSYDAAKKAMNENVEFCKKLFNLNVVKSVDYFNSSKGLKIYEKEAVTKDGVEFHWSLVDGFFED